MSLIKRNKWFYGGDVNGFCGDEGREGGTLWLASGHSPPSDQPALEENQMGGRPSWVSIICCFCCVAAVAVCFGAIGQGERSKKRNSHTPNRALPFATVIGRERGRPALITASLGGCHRSRSLFCGRVVRQRERKGKSLGLRCIRMAPGLTNLLLSGSPLECGREVRKPIMRVDKQVRG